MRSGGALGFSSRNNLQFSCNCFIQQVMSGQGLCLIICIYLIKWILSLLLEANTFLCVYILNISVLANTFWATILNNL